MDDSLFKELLNGPTDSQSDWTTGKWLLLVIVRSVIIFEKYSDYPFLFLSILDVATNLSMIEKVLDDSVEDPSITSSGEIDEISDESIPTVETEKEESEPSGSKSVEEASVLITPAGFEE